MINQTIFSQNGWVRISSYLQELQMFDQQYAKMTYTLHKLAEIPKLAAKKNIDFQRQPQMYCDVGKKLLNELLPDY